MTIPFTMFMNICSLLFDPGVGGVQICPQSPKFEKKTCFSNNFIPGTKGPRHLKWVYIKDFCKNLLVSPFLGKSLPPGVQEADLPSWLPYSTYLCLDFHLFYMTKLKGHSGEICWYPPEDWPEFNLRDFRVVAGFGMKLSKSCQKISKRKDR